MLLLGKCSCPCHVIWHKTPAQSIFTKLNEQANFISPTSVHYRYQKETACTPSPLKVACLFSAAVIFAKGVGDPRVPKPLPRHSVAAQNQKYWVEAQGSALQGAKQHQAHPCPQAVGLCTPADGECSGEMAPMKSQKKTHTQQEVHNLFLATKDGQSLSE